MNAKEIVAKILSDNGLNPSQFAKSLGIHPTRIYDLQSGKISVITSKLAETIVDHYPMYSRAWLMSGEGEPLADPHAGTPAPAHADIIEEADVLEEIPFAPKAVLEERGKSLKPMVRQGSDKLETKNMADLLESFDYISPVISMAMAPLFKLGDYVFLRFLPRDAEVIDGEIYSIDTNRYGCILRRVKVEEGGYRLKALKRGYDDILVAREEVFSFAIVVHLLRTGSGYSMDVVDESEEARRNIRQVLNAQDELIAEIREQNKRMEGLVNHLIKDAE